MIDCRCPKCGKLFEVASSADFGTAFTCAACGFRDTLDTGHLAHFRLPESIRLQLVGEDGQPLEVSGVVLILEYGYQLPPLRTDAHGRVVVPERMFQEAQKDDVSRDRGDYTLNRRIDVAVPSDEELRTIASRRRSSGWGVSSLEEKLYGNIDALVSAYMSNNNSSIKPTKMTIDLENAAGIVDLSLKVQ